MEPPTVGDKCVSINMELVFFGWLTFLKQKSRPLFWFFAFYVPGLSTNPIPFNRARSLCTCGYHGLLIIPASFSLFSSISRTIQLQIKKFRCYIRASNPGPQECKCRRIHTAMSDIFIRLFFEKRHKHLTKKTLFRLTSEGPRVTT